MQKKYKPIIFENITCYTCAFAFFVVPLHRKQKFADILKAFISACFGNLKTGNFHPIRNKKAVNALWDMYIPPQSVHTWTALFGGISYSAWALLAYSRLVGLPEPQERE